MNEEHSDLCVGIDLGTTNSVLATVNVTPSGKLVSNVFNIARCIDIFTSPVSGNEPKLNMFKGPLLPSCVYYREERDGKYRTIVGDFAKKQYSMRPSYVARSIKSQMGRSAAEGLSQDVSDKTPQAVSAQILKHMLSELKKVYHREISDAIITVPANFDAAMRQATLQAASMAGIAITNAEGSKRQVLLSEPNAVIYDLLNQIQNGEISSHILDLSRKQRVLVFDIGGGTLDITLHEISRGEQNPEVLQVDEVATNRYTRLAGDDFDNLLARNMYERYLNQYKEFPEVTQRIKREKDAVMAQLLVYAENLKIEINDEVSNQSLDDNWGDEEFHYVGGNMSNGYAYDDQFTKEEFEGIVRRFLGSSLKFNDYKQFEDIQNPILINTIIYPILDVLQKASKKLNQDDVKADAVVLNGGMSKLYLIKERLKQFFGFEPIVVLDPDQAVARGAAVYHHFLHKYGESEAGLSVSEPEPPLEQTESGIQLRKTILNEAIYLSTKGGVKHLLVDAGNELPFYSDIVNGFALAPDQNEIRVPIMQKEMSGDNYRVVVSGVIKFKQKYGEGAYVSIYFTLNRDKILSLEAWTSQKKDGSDVIEKGSVLIRIGEGDPRKPNTRNKMLAPQGSKLIAANELSSLQQVCARKSRPSHRLNPKQAAEINAQIRLKVKTLISCGNPEDFAEPILLMLQRPKNEYFTQRLIIIGRKIARHWTPEQRKALAGACMSLLSPELTGYVYSTYGEKVNTNQQCIMTIGLCGDQTLCEKLNILRSDKKYEQALLYVYAVTQTEAEWILRRLKGPSSQSAMWAIGVALQRNGKCEHNLPLTDVVELIIRKIHSLELNLNELISAIISLSLICDQRPSAVDMISGDILDQVRQVIQEAMYRYDSPGLFKSGDIALQMLNGEMLDAENEAFLLQKIDLDEYDN
ncbi:MAG: Hsp70 family protein [Clostridiales bacterium]|jgi:molecular chaperone DnaK (HSP70)|nr:Hsp70 family protein [Clostridiales bacterium]